MNNIIKKDLTLDWNSLSIGEQSEYETRAYYLINDGYVMNIEVEELAKKIHDKENKNDDTK
jgi:hypothetical protein